MTNHLTDTRATYTPTAATDAQREAAIDRLYRDAEEAGMALLDSWQPDEIEVEELEKYERTRYERWTALSEDEKQIVLDASDEEYAARYDAGVYQRG